MIRQSVAEDVCYMLPKASRMCENVWQSCIVEQEMNLKRAGLLTNSKYQSASDLQQPAHKAGEITGKHFSCFCYDLICTGNCATDLWQTYFWMYVLITKHTCEQWQSAEPADSTGSSDLSLKMFSALVRRADFKDTALCLLSEWSLDDEVFPVFPWPKPQE